MKVVVLSRDYIPLMYCDIHRAITLVYLKKAEIVKESGNFLRSVSERFPIPKVIRLLCKLVRQITPRVTYTRKNIHIRDNYTCQYCGSTSTLTLDHVMPVSRGGKSSWENVVTACYPCNSRKGSRTPDEAGMKLAMPPKKPSILMQIDWNDLFGIELA
ncbi:MAG TPA: HNH endonuclease [Candidatus Obscuribacterales bacterium]